MDPVGLGHVPGPSVEEGLDLVAGRDFTPDGTIAVTLLRCVGWLSRDDLDERRGPAGPGTATPGAQMPGKWAFDYAIITTRYSLDQTDLPGAQVVYTIEREGVPLTVIKKIGQ